MSTRLPSRRRPRHAQWVNATRRRCMTNQKATGMSRQPKKRGLSIEQRAELWQRWKDGQSLSEIGRALCKPPGSVHTYLSVLGGIAPATRRRSELALTGREREEISRQLCAGSSMRLIAKLLRRPPSTISREISRNGGREAYRADAADSRAWVHARRPKCCKLRQHRRLQR